MFSMAPKKGNRKRPMVEINEETESDSESDAPLVRRPPGIRDDASRASEQQPKQKKSKKQITYTISTPVDSWVHGLEGDEHKRMSQYIWRQFKPERIPDFSLLRTVENGYKRVSDYLDKHWIQLFKINQPAYSQLVVEFLSTYEFLPDRSLDYKKAITFKLGGSRRYLSVNDFGCILGLYSKRDTRSPEWAEALTDWPLQMSSKHARDAFWAKIARTQPTPPPSTITSCGEPGSPTSSSDLAPATTAIAPPKPKATQLKDPALRFIHRCISNTIHHRHNSQGRVTDQDLFLLYGLHEKRAINLAYVLAKYLMKFSARKLPGTLSGGCYITILAEHFNILTPEILATLAPLAKTETLDPAMLIDSFIIHEDENGGRVFALEGGALPDELPLPSTKRGGDQTAPKHKRGRIKAARDQGMSSAHSSALIPVTPPPPPPGSNLDQVLAMLTTILTEQRGTKERVTRIEEKQVRILALLQDTGPSQPLSQPQVVSTSAPVIIASAPVTQMYARSKRSASTSTASTSHPDTPMIRDPVSALPAEASVPSTHKWCRPRPMM